jgi:hypothetical protein
MITLNALRGVRARVHMPKTGAWIADVDVDLDAVPVAPSGRALLTIGVNALTGTVDDRASGRFGSKAHVRLVAGGGGWDKVVPGVHLHNDAGVLSSAVYAAVGAAVGESVVELGIPRRLGVDFVCMRGAASQIFAGVDWYVDELGITRVGPRVPVPAPPTADVLSWDPTNKVAEIASDLLITPGMTLTDPVRFGVATVEDVEHSFGDGGTRALARCSTPSLLGAAASAALASPPPAAGGKIVQALAALARQAAQTSALKKYPYRVVTQGVDGRLTLQATDPKSEAPPFLRLIDIWAGVAGVSLKLAPASVVLVSFIDGDKARPIVTGFDPKSPPVLQIRLDAVRVVAGEVGASAVAKADQVLACITAVAAAGGLTSAAMLAAITPFTSSIPSTKLFTD